MGEPRRPTSAAGGRTVHCLILLPRGHDAPLDLLDGLRQRGVAVREVSDGPAAMATLAEESFGVLIIVEPGMWSDAQPLIRAVRRYHPAVRLWQYRWSEEPRLCRLSRGTGKSETGETKDRRMESPRSRRMEESTEPRAEEVRDRGQEINGNGAALHSLHPPAAAPPTPSLEDDDFDASPVVLSSEELAMLLGEGEPRGTGGSR